MRAAAGVRLGRVAVVVGDLGGLGVLVLLAGPAAVWWPSLLGPLARWSVWVGSVLVLVGFVSVAPGFSREWRPPVGGAPPAGAGAAAPLPPGAAGLAAAPSPPAIARPLPTATPTPVVVVPSPTAEPPAGAFAPRGVSHAAGGAIGGPGQTDRYAFRAERRQLLEARLKRAPGGSLYGALALVAPSGAEERSVSANDRGEAFLEVRDLAGSGAYTLAVSGVGGTTGPYTLTWTLDRFGRLVDGAAVDAEIGESGQWDRYRIEARQGQRLEARVRRASGAGFYGTLSLVDPAGAEEKSGTPNDQGGAFLQVQRLASSGTYTLVVSGVGGAVGPYTVSLVLR